MRTQLLSSASFSSAVMKNTRFWMSAPCVSSSAMCRTQSGIPRNSLRLIRDKTSYHHNTTDRLGNASVSPFFLVDKRVFRDWLPPAASARDVSTAARGRHTRKTHCNAELRGRMREGRGSWAGSSPPGARCAARLRRRCIGLTGGMQGIALERADGRGEGAGYVVFLEGSHLHTR